MENKEVLEKLNQISRLLEHSLAAQLYLAGLTQPQIAAQLRISVGFVNKLVKGIKQASK